MFPVVLTTRIRILESDEALRWYGAALALTSTWTSVHWLVDLPIASVLSPDGVAVCWPFAPDCGDLRVLAPPVVTAVAVLLGVCGVWNAWLFADATRVRPAYKLLIALAVVRYSLIALDFRLTLNHHYITAWVLLTYVIWPDRRSLAILLVAVYFWSGILKLRPGSDWMSGAFLLDNAFPFGLAALTSPWALFYVLVLELIVVFGLLLRRAVIFWASFAQVIVFHVSSLWVIGYLFPLFMLSLLAIFPLARRWPNEEARLAAGRRYAVVVAFSALQLTPYLFPGNPALTGEGRLFSLSMFDAPVECRAQATVAGEPPVAVPLRVPFLNSRIRCDPIIYMAAALDMCARSAVALDLLLEVRKAGEVYYRPLVDSRDVCRHRPTYTLLRHNTWIRPLR